jgi:hypothetical protein
VTDQNDTGEEDFATLFAASVQSKRLQNGQTVDGIIVGIGPEVALVDVGAKSEATIAIAELKNEDEGIAFRQPLSRRPAASRCRAGCSAGRRPDSSSKTPFGPDCPWKAKSKVR